MCWPAVSYEGTEALAFIGSFKSREAYEHYAANVSEYEGRLNNSLLQLRVASSGDTPGLMDIAKLTA